MAEPVLARPEYGTGNPRRTKGIARRERENERAGPGATGGEGFSGSLLSPSRPFPRGPLPAVPASG